MSHRGVLAICGGMRSGLVRIRKELEVADGTHQLERAEIGTGLDTV